jgi:hypothetical protein
MKTYEHIFKIGLPIALEDEDLLQVKVETISNSVEYDENEQNAKERSGLILQRIGFDFKKGLIRNIITQLSNLTDDQIEQLELDKELIDTKETEEDIEQLLYQK